MDRQGVESVDRWESEKYPKIADYIAVLLGQCRQLWRDAVDIVKIRKTLQRPLIGQIGEWSRLRIKCKKCFVGCGCDWHMQEEKGAHVTSHLRYLISSIARVRRFGNLVFCHYSR
jgi:hypothetical protein